MRNQHQQGVYRVASGAAMGLIAVLACGCSGAIHKEANIGGTDTLSIDARQRLLLVGDRQDEHGSKRVRCAEPSPDSLVATTSVLSAGANVSKLGSAGVSGSGNLAAKTAESAASIGYRDSSIQMLRDAYFRLCEAYMNGVLSDDEYGHVVENADTYLAVASALQIMGADPVAPAVAISASPGGQNGGQAGQGGQGGGGQANLDSDRPSDLIQTASLGPFFASADTPPTQAGKPPKTPASKDPNADADDEERAKITRYIVYKYLAYREKLRRATDPHLQGSPRPHKPQRPEH